MKFRLSLKDKEASLEADIEKIVEKRMDQKAQMLDGKTRYQIKSAEKRKNEELKHKQQMQLIFILLSIIGVCLVLGIVASILNV